MKNPKYETSQNATTTQQESRLSRRLRPPESPIRGWEAESASPSPPAHRTQHLPPSNMVLAGPRAPPLPVRNSRLRAASPGVLNRGRAVSTEKVSSCPSSSLLRDRHRALATGQVRARSLGPQGEGGQSRARLKPPSLSVWRPRPPARDPRRWATLQRPPLQHIVRSLPPSVPQTGFLVVREGPRSLAGRSLNTAAQRSTAWGHDACGRPSSSGIARKSLPRRREGSRFPRSASERQDPASMPGHRVCRHSAAERESG